MKKKGIALLLILMMLCSFIPAAALAEGTESAGEIAENAPEGLPSEEMTQTESPEAGQSEATDEEQTETEENGTDSQEEPSGSTERFPDFDQADSNSDDRTLEGESEKAVARYDTGNGWKYAETLQEALDGVCDNGTVELTKPLNADGAETYRITKSMTLRGNSIAVSKTRMRPVLCITNAANVTLEKITLDGNSTEQWTNFIQVDGAELTIGSQTRLTGWSGMKQGPTSPIYLKNHATLRMTDGEIAENIGCQEYGGAVYAEASTIQMAGGSLKNNVCENGGAIFGKNRSEIILNGGSIEGNAAKLSNGWNATTFGGAVYVEDGTIRMTGGSIRGNSASKSGGAIFLARGEFAMEGGNISENYLQGNEKMTSGAAVYIDSSKARGCMNGGTICDNFGADSGGGIYTDSATFCMTGGKIEGNDAKQYGGGISSSTGEIRVENGTISDNTAAKGGGICINNEIGAYATLLINDGIICGNRAKYGGGAVASFGDIQINGGTICNNLSGSAETEGLGGAVLIEVLGNNQKIGLTMTGGSIRENTAGNKDSRMETCGRGGGIAVLKGSLKLEGGTVMENDATGSGGGIYAEVPFTIGEKAVLYNNNVPIHGSGDDIQLGNEDAAVALPEVKAGWKLDGTPNTNDCKQNIDGWYDDSEGERWNAHTDRESLHILSFDTGALVSGVKGIKAAHDMLREEIDRPAEFQFQKQERFSEKPLSGVKFELYRDGEKQQEFQSDQNGMVCITGLTEGDYMLKEVQSSRYRPIGEISLKVVSGKEISEEKLDADGEYKQMLIHPHELEPVHHANIVQKDGKTVLYNDTLRNLTVRQIWEDDNDRKGIRPKQETVKILANGKTVEKLKLSQKTDWSGTVTGLPKYTKNGKVIRYTVKKESIPGYQTKTEILSPSEIVITDTLKESHAPIDPDPIDPEPEIPPIDPDPVDPEPEIPPVDPEPEEPDHGDNGEAFPEDGTETPETDPEVRPEETPDTDTESDEHAQNDENRDPSDSDHADGHPAHGTDPDGDNPKTGDDSRIRTYAIMMVVSFGLLLAMVINHRKQNRTEE